MITFFKVFKVSIPFRFFVQTRPSSPCLLVETISGAILHAIFRVQIPAHFAVHDHFARVHIRNNFSILSDGQALALQRDRPFYLAVNLQIFVAEICPFTVSPGPRVARLRADGTLDRIGAEAAGAAVEPKLLLDCGGT